MLEIDLFALKYVQSKQYFRADIEFLNFYVEDFWSDGVVENMIIEQKKNAIN